MISGKISTRTSLIRCRNPVAVRARASSTPALRPTYPHSPRGLFASRGSPLNGCAWWEASPDVSEHVEPIYYLPERRPQAAAPPSSRCAPHSVCASICPWWLHGLVSMVLTASAAAAADTTADAAALRRSAVDMHASRAIPCSVIASTASLRVSCMSVCALAVLSALLACRIHEHAYPALPAPSSSDVDCSEPRVPCDLR